LADNNFRSYRGRQTPAPERAGATAGGGNDPLAELARLIGQSDPYAERQYDPQARRRPAEEAPAHGHEWADEEEIEQAYAAEGRYAQAPAMPRAAPLWEYVSQSDEREYEQEPPVGQYYSGPSGSYVGYQDGADTQGVHEQPQFGEDRPVPDFLTSAPQNHSEFAEPEHDAGDAYAHDDYYQPSRRRRGGLVLVMAVLVLAVVGTASAFAYRTMFGGSLLPALPPIIKASSAPNKVVPNSGDAQAANSSQTGATNTAGTEKLVAREEQPINIEQANPAPKVVSTIPVTSGESSPVPPSVVAAITPTPSPALPAPVGPAPSAGPNWPPAPTAAPPVTAAPVQPTPPANSANSASTPASPPSAPTPASKKIHTVTIRPDQAGGTDAAPGSSPPPAARSATHGAASARTNSPDGNAPLALVPGSGDTARPAHSRRTAAPISVASAAPANANAEETPRAAGYAVQVSSQHSETEAQSSFQALRAKYPDLLGKREPIIRRADLGAKGIYYRALVGPFASAQEAAAMCSSLKAAGGNCLVQKN
jgi:hypothetical protein